MGGRVKEVPGLYFLVVALVASIFLLDLATPIGTATWVLYTIPLMLCLLGGRPIAPLAVAFCAGLLVLLGYLLSEPGPSEFDRIAPVNRALVVGILAALGVLGRTFITTKLRLLQEDWIKQGYNELSTVMRGEQRLDELGRKVLAQLGRFLDAQVGAAYTRDPSGSFRLSGTFARGGGLVEPPATLRPGEDLIGHVAESGETLVVRDVPEGYVDVRSGLGAAKPKALLLVPTVAEGQVNGVLELGFFTPPSPATIEFVERARESIGFAFRSAKFRARQAELLKETQRQAEELQQQQEELRVANEELEEQSRTLKESQRRLEQQRAELEQSNAALSEQAHVLQEQKEQLLATQDLLQHKAAEIARASRYKSEFLANMSHELRTPLNSSLILAKLLMDNPDGNLSQEQVRYASNIYNAGNDLLALINDILDLAKIESGHTDLEIESVSLPELFERLRQRFEPMARQKGLSLSVDWDESCPRRIESDSRRLQQILTNLLSNAVKFTEAGSVVFGARASEAGGVELWVEDTGIGIPADQHEAVFEVFRQGDGTTNRRYGGTGLGLPISRELSVLLGGSLHLASAPREGSRFSLQLPLHGVPAPEVPRSSPPAPATPEPPPAAPPLAPPLEDDRDRLDERSRVVLAIEDDPSFAAILRDLAHEMHFRCILARTAEEGIRLAQEYLPVAILLDIGLPDHSGLTVLEILKRSPRTRHIPIHVVSVHDYQQVAKEMGVVGYALKPVKREELEDAFRRLEAHLSRATRSVLVVEDDEVQREALAELLQVEGVEICAVSSAGVAFELLQERSFDCMVVDLMLPGASGFELLERMGQGGAPYPPVIVYTARALSAVEEQRLRQHAKSIIVKGARSPERLLEEVTLFLHQMESRLPAEKRRMLQKALSREAIYEGRRILLVEDDVRNIFALSSALEPKGATIEIARNGREAVERVQREPPIDLVLMDVMMPEMDGLSATRAIRKIPALESLPIIALTAKAMPDDRQRCLDAGASDYIAKPISVDKLVSMVRVWMPR